MHGEPGQPIRQDFAVSEYMLLLLRRESFGEVQFRCNAYYRKTCGKDRKARVVLPDLQRL
jgi:hypothetical protein